MRKTMNFVLLTLLAALVAGPSFGQAVTFTGKLQIGFGDQDNQTGFRSNNAVPICAGRGPAVNPGTVGTTLGTLIVNAQGAAVPGVGGAVTFNAVTGTNGGAQEKTNATCNVAIPGFANPRLRSRTQVGAAHWPSRKGAFTTMINTAPVPTNPTATYMLSLGGGNEQAGVFTSWTVMNESGTFMDSGTASTATIPFYGTGLGRVRIQPNSGMYGGGVPFSGGGGVQLGVNFTTMTPGGAVLVPGDYGIVFYANGFLPTTPQIFGTEATGVNILNQVTNTVYGPTPSLFTYTIGVINGRQDLTYAARTPGGTTVDQQGFIRTTMGGNTQTPVGGGGIPLISPVAFTGVFGEFTTGKVTYVDDKVGDFTTVRSASGFDVPVSPGTAISGETRRLQVVSPWGATIRTVGPFGLPLPQLGFGGIAQLDVRVIPAPEPGTLAMLGFGVAGLLGLGAARRRNG